MQPAVDAARPGAMVDATPEDTLPDAATMMAAAPTAGPRHWMALDTWKPPTCDAQAPSPTASTASEISCCDAAMDTSAAVDATGAARGAATKLPSGLVVEDVVVGGGDYPSATSTITMDFAARVGGFDGEPYVTSPATGVRVDLGTDAIAPGLKEAILADARVGTTRRVVVPPSLGYGATGFPREDGTAAGAKGSIVPPDATLYYEFKIRSITLSRGIGFGLNFF
mmetsp:Transcript_19921/g.69084  ORF Transcript_19921/g.69084 Transcript_19921/m.69084 type:complete len:225 (-) Transcript_19921:34-708(-)